MHFIKGFVKVRSLSLSLVLSPPLWCRGVEVSGQNKWTLTDARPGWVTLSEVSGSSLPTLISSCISCFQLLICMQEWPLCKRLQKTDLFGCSHDSSSELVLPTSSEPVDNRPPTQEGKPAWNLPVSVKDQDLTRHQLLFFVCKFHGLISSKLDKLTEKLLWVFYVPFISIMVLGAFVLWSPLTDSCLVVYFFSTLALI